MLPALLIGLAVSGVGFFVVWKGVKGHRLAQASLAWPAVSGRIDSQSFEETTERDSEGDLVTTYYVRLRYAYEHAGRPYLGERIHHGGSETTHLKRARAWQDRYAAGRSATVYVNPEDPSYAVLEPKGGGSHLVTVVVGLFLAAFGLVVALAAV